VVYDATDPRRAKFFRAASQSSVFNPVTGEFDGSSSVSGDSEVTVTVTGHETNETPAEKNRFERNLETIFVDAGSSHTPPDDAEDASSEYADRDYPVNPVGLARYPNEYPLLDIRSTLYSTYPMCIPAPTSYVQQERGVLGSALLGSGSSWLGKKR
jgi:hypothetical protein